MPREIAMRHRLPQFNHLFTSERYSAGYYSYLWSDDGRRHLGGVRRHRQMCDPTVAATERAMFILAPGNDSDRAEAYRLFRGRDPDVNALLKKRGFPMN